MDFFNYDSVRETYIVMKNATGEDHNRFATIFVMWSIAHMVYYIVAGLVVWSIGRRLIQASFAAFKEARRERA